MLSGTVMVRAETVVRLQAAAEEHGASLGRMASLAIEAAVRTYRHTPRTTAMPVPTSGRPAECATVMVTVAHHAFALLTEISAERCVSIDEQIAAVLDATVAGYRPVDIVRTKALDRQVTKVKAVPKRRPFDPAYYARHCVEFQR